MKVLRFLGIVVVVLAFVLLPGCKDGGTTPLSVIGTWLSDADKTFDYEDDGVTEITFKSGTSLTLGSGIFNFVTVINLVDDLTDYGFACSGTVSPTNPDTSGTISAIITAITVDDLDFATVDDVLDFRIKNLTSTTCDADMDLDSVAGFELTDWAFTKQ